MEEESIKPFYFRRFNYDESFNTEIEEFQRNIKKDPRLQSENKKLDANRFSRAIRMVIKLYNQTVQQIGFPKVPDKQEK